MARKQIPRPSQPAGKPPKAGPPQTTDGNKRAFDMRPKPGDARRHDSFTPDRRLVGEEEAFDRPDGED